MIPLFPSQIRSLQTLLEKTHFRLKVKASHLFSKIILTLTIILGMVPVLFSTQTTSQLPISSSLTNAIPRSIFHETESRDPFSPIGYQRPANNSSHASKMVDFELKITGISNFGDTPMATLSTGEVIEPGGTYKLKTENSKDIIEYKVLNITEDSVVILYANKEYSFRLKESNLDSFKEKEESDEDTKP